MLKEPLKCDLRKTWDCYFETYDNSFLANRQFRAMDLGVEDLQIKFKDVGYRGYNEEAGYNAIEVRDSAHGWIRNVRLTNTDIGIGLVNTNNFTVLDVSLDGRMGRDGIVNSSGCFDNLALGFNIDCPRKHGIGVGDASGYNVFADGRIRLGAFDSHRDMNFTNLRTQIEINSTGFLGGDWFAGPVQGARSVHWNIWGKGNWLGVNDTHAMPKGALVGIRGFGRAKPRGLSTDLPSNGSRFPLVDCRVEMEGKTPDIENLYLAQVAHRLGKLPPWLTKKNGKYSWHRPETK